MAQPMLNLGGNLTPEQQIQQQQIARQQRMAELLMQQGQQTPTGQMVSGRYVAPSFFQYAAPLLQGYLGKKELEKVEQRQLDMAKELRANEMSAMTDYMQQKQGRPEIAEQVTEMAGPYTGNVPMPTATMAAQPSIPANPQAALANLLSNPKATQAQRQFAFQKMNEGPIKVGVEDTLIDPMTMKPVFTGAGKPRAPLQIDTGTSIELRDPANPTVVLQTIPKSQMPTAGQIVERDDGTFLVDTRTGQARPVMGVGGKQLAGKTKVLPEGLNKQVTGAVNLTDAITDYQTKIQDFSVKDFASPDKRAEMGNLYNNMMLQAKEAYNLGVLNGPDYDILQRVVKDPTNVSSLAFSNTALSKQADSLRKTSSDIVKNAYLSQGREVPADIAAKFVKKEESKTEKPKDGNVDIQSQLRTKGIPYQPKLYEYRVNPDGSVDRKRKIL